MANDKHDNDQHERERHERERQDREQRQQQPAPKQPTAAERQAADKAKAEAREVQAFGSIGAQIILDYNGDGSLGARGGLSGTIEENTVGRDAHLIALGLDPLTPSGPPPSMEVRKARAEAAKAQAEADAKIAAAHAQPGAGAASRVSSLAAGLITEPADVPIDPGDTLSGGRSAA